MIVILHSFCSSRQSSHSILSPCLLLCIFIIIFSIIFYPFWLFAKDYLHVTSFFYPLIFADFISSSVNVDSRSSLHFILLIFPLILFDFVFVSFILFIPSFPSWSFWWFIIFIFLHSRILYFCFWWPRILSFLCFRLVFFFHIESDYSIK